MRAVIAVFVIVLAGCAGSSGSHEEDQADAQESWEQLDANTQELLCVMYNDPDPTNIDAMLAQNTDSVEQAKREMLEEYC